MAVDPRAPHALYRFFGAGGTLLYIGITNDLGRRLGRHGDEKPWWVAVSSMTVEHFPDRASVLEAERRAIKKERPLYNVVHNDDPQAVPAPVSGVLDVICQLCKEDMDFGLTGALHVNLRAAVAAETTQRKWDAHHVGGLVRRSDLDDLPEVVVWRVECEDCLSSAGHDCGSCYSLSTAECRTLSDLIRWTAHLADKDWLRCTNWMDMIRAVVDGSNKTGLRAQPADQVVSY